MKTKICTKCKKELPLTEFYKGNDRNSLAFNCKKCQQKQHRQYVIKNRKNVKIRQQRWQLKNKDSVRKWHQIYNKSARGIFKATKARAKVRNIPFDISKTEFIAWYNKQPKVCVYCNRNENDTFLDTNKNIQRLTLDRKNNKNGYTLKNLVLCCYRCNTEKGNFWTYEEMLQKGKLSEKIYTERKKCQENYI